MARAAEGDDSDEGGPHTCHGASLQPSAFTAAGGKAQDVATTEFRSVRATECGISVSGKEVDWCQENA